MTNRGDRSMNRISAGRSIALLITAVVVALGAAIVSSGVWLGLDNHGLLRLTGWLAGGAAISLAIGILLVWVVDRAADGRYLTRLAISGILTALVLSGTAIVPLWRLDLPDAHRSLRWIIFAFATVVAGLFALLAAWFDAYPIRTVAMGALDIARGNYRARMPEMGNDEIVQLATATNLLAARAQTSAIRQSNQDRARESLLLAIAGDARIPIDNLRAISGALSNARQLEPAVLRRSLEIIDRETSALQRRIDEVEEIARLESGQVTLRLQPISLAPLVIAVCDRLQPGATIRNILIGPRVDFSAPHVLVDPEQTFRALEALISYALSETPDGSELAVEMRGSDQFIQIAVREIPSESANDTATRIEWESAHRHRESALSLAVAGRLIELQSGSFLISRGQPGTPIVVVSLPRSQESTS